MTQIQTHITRGNIIESTHKSKCVIKNYNYKTVFSTKNNKDLVYPRSAIKILQAIPFIQSKAKNKYSKLFSNDKKNTSLNNWNQFEINNPDTFLEMYKFWVRKKQEP